VDGIDPNIDMFESYLFQGEKTLKADGSKLGTGLFCTVKYDDWQLSVVDFECESTGVSSNW